MKSLSNTTQYVKLKDITIQILCLLMGIFCETTIFVSTTLRAQKIMVFFSFLIRLFFFWCFFLLCLSSIPPLSIYLSLCVYAVHTSKERGKYFFLVTFSYTQMKSLKINSNSNSDSLSNTLPLFNIRFHKLVLKMKFHILWSLFVGNYIP